MPLNMTGINSNAIYVFDRGYVDYERFDQFAEDGIFFLSRLIKNAVIQEINSFKVPEESTVTSDSVVVPIVLIV